MAGKDHLKEMLDGPVSMQIGKLVGNVFSMKEIQQKLNNSEFPNKSEFTKVTKVTSNNFVRYNERGVPIKIQYKDIKSQFEVTPVVYAHMDKMVIFI